MKLRHFLPSTFGERRNSRITFLESAEIAVMWSPKAACTTAIVWAFRHNGLLEEALEYSPWIHRYRLQRYQKSERYIARLRNLGAHSRYVIKIVRNPFERAVSSFLHAYRHAYEDVALAEALGRRIDAGQRFSFREFVDYLGRINLRRCNPHHRVQSTPLERHILFGLKPHRTIKMEEGLDRALAEVERDFGLPPTDFSNPVFSSIHHTSRGVSADPAADQKDLGDQALPPAMAFYDDGLVERIAHLYAEDFERYGYDPKPSW